MNTVYSKDKLIFIGVMAVSLANRVVRIQKLLYGSIHVPRPAFLTSWSGCRIFQVGIQFWIFMLGTHLLTRSPK